MGANAVIQTRVDYRVLAAIAQTYADSGRSPASIGWNRADLMRFVLMEYHDLLKNAGILKPITSTEEAVEIMNKLGYGLMAQGTKGLTAVAKAINAEDAAASLRKSSTGDAGRYQSAMDMLSGDADANQD